MQFCDRSFLIVKYIFKVARNYSSCNDRIPTTLFDVCFKHIKSTSIHLLISRARSATGYIVASRTEVRVDWSPFMSAAVCFSKWVLLGERYVQDRYRARVGHLPKTAIRHILEIFHCANQIDHTMPASMFSCRDVVGFCKPYCITDTL